MASRIVKIESTKAKLTSSQREFNRLIKKIDEYERAINDFREGLVEIRQRVATELTPLQQEYFDLKKEIVFCLDQAYESGSHTKTELKKIAYVILEISGELIDKADFMELVPLYNKYSPEPYEEGTEEDVAAQIKDLFSMFGMDFDEEIDLKDPEKFQAQMEQKIAEKEEEMAQEKRRAEERKAKRPKSQKQLEREQKKELEERTTTKSVRSVYMDLVKTFHPDRETDAAERERKTQIMQRVTDAYNKNDLLALLRLQLEFERINQNDLEGLAEDQLKSFNKLLKNQLAEIQDELETLQTHIAMMTGRHPFMISTIQDVRRFFENDLEALATDVRIAKQDRIAFEDKAKLKAFLKEVKIPKRPKRDDDFFDFMF